MPSRSSVPRTKGVSMPTPSSPTPPPGISHSSPKAVAKTYAAMSRDPTSPSSPPMPVSACHSPRMSGRRAGPPASLPTARSHRPWRSAQRHAGPRLPRAGPAMSDAIADGHGARSRANGSSGSGATRGSVRSSSSSVCGRRPGKAAMSSTVGPHRPPAATRLWSHRGLIRSGRQRVPRSASCASSNPSKSHASCASTRRVGPIVDGWSEVLRESHSDQAVSCALDQVRTSSGACTVGRPSAAFRNARRSRRDSRRGWRMSKTASR